jgi:hypothetical protein
MSDLQYQDFVRKPFKVEAVQVTKENMEELAKHIGEVRQKDDGTPYIFVDKRLVPNVYRVFPGFWVTKMGDNVRCYSEKVFHSQFEESNIDWRVYFDAIETEQAEEVVA